MGRSNAPSQLPTDYNEVAEWTSEIGNGVATIVVSKMEGDFDADRYRAAVDRRPGRRIDNHSFRDEPTE